MKQIIFIIISFSLYCTHHTSVQQYAMPPEIVSINPSATGHYIVARIMNPELLLAGYSIHTGSTPQNATSNENGVHCSTLTVIPNVPVTYTFQADTSSGVSSGVICKFSKNLTSGEYVVIRSLLFSIKTDSAASTVVYSPPSNSIIVP